jgi:hypothetical protein
MLKNSIIEISKKKAKAGRTPITMVLHKISKDDSDYNKNGIVWVKEYCEQNIESIKGMQLVTQFLDENHEIPFGAHGDMVVEENRVIFEDSLVVGSFEGGYIAENIEVNGEIIDAVVGNGYIYNQRFPKLVDFLQEQFDSNNPVEGSVEISAATSLGNNKIIYDGGWKEKGRKPQIFDYSGHAIVIGEVPADDSALMLELNIAKKVGENLEINQLNYDDICYLLSRKFYDELRKNPDYIYNDYYIYRFYPQSYTVVMKNWDKPGEYFMFQYKEKDNDVFIGEIVKVSEDWKPVNGESSIEVNSKLIMQKIKKEGGIGMENLIREKDIKITELNTKITELNNKVAELTSSIEEKEIKINELNTTIVEVNKTLESEKQSKTSMEEELNTLREFKSEQDKVAKQNEVNEYFEKEIMKNGFTEEEINSLKTYVESVDLNGLKSAETELCVKKFKELSKVKKELETNSTQEINFFVKTKQEDLDNNDIEAGKQLFK